jgi:hypothetical protein
MVANLTLAQSNLACEKKENAMKVFKVMTQKDRAFGGKFNPEKIEEALNAMGKEGWQIDGVTSAEFPSLTGGRQELVIFLSKDV